MAKYLDLEGQLWPTMDDLEKYYLIFPYFPWQFLRQKRLEKSSYSPARGLYTFILLLFFEQVVYRLDSTIQSHPAAISSNYMSQIIAKK